MTPKERREQSEAVKAAYMTWVPCAGCGRSMRGLSIICSRCKFKPRTRLT